MLVLKKNHWIVFALLVLISFQCKQDNKLYEKDKTGLRYKFFVKNIDAKKAAIGDVLELKYKLVTEQDSLIEETDLFRMRLKPSSHPGGSIEDGLALMHEGDSAVFLIDAEKYYNLTRGIKMPKFLKKGSNIKFYMKLNEILDLNDLASYKKKMYHRNMQQETILLDDFLKRSNITVEPTNSGLYFVELRKGKGKKPMPGQTVVVNYTGYFIDGNIFSTSYKLSKPFEFKFGSGEVIPGWEEGIAKMHIGGKYKLIIPSHLAYGAEGKGTKILPFSTLIFDIELLGVK
ncbi:MAG: hypothetical protein GXO79_06825 [Chlorobi bacterium]|nr:hypothetical protein [Chlorobiota bacterium]